MLRLGCWNCCFPLGGRLLLSMGSAPIGGSGGARGGGKAGWLCLPRLFLEGCDLDSLGECKVGISLK